MDILETTISTCLKSKGLKIVEVSQVLSTITIRDLENDFNLSKIEKSNISPLGLEQDSKNRILY